MSWLISRLAACVLQCLMSQAFELRLSLVLSQPSPTYLDSTRILTPVSQQMLLSQKKCLERITDGHCELKKVKSTIPHEECWWGGHLPYLGVEPIGR